MLCNIIVFVVHTYTSVLYGRWDSVRWFVYAFLSTMIYAVIPILDKINCTRSDPMIIAAASSMLSSCILIAYCMMHKSTIEDTAWNISLIDGAYIAITALLTAISWGLYYGAVQCGPVSKISTLDSVGFILTMLFSAYILQETIALQTCVGIVIMLIGLCMVVY